MSSTAQQGSSSQGGGAHTGSPALAPNGPGNVVLPNDFDLEGYAANYSGHAKLSRLLFIAQNVKNFEIPAYKLAVTELKKTTNTSLYKEIFDKVGSRLGPDCTYDQAWVELTEKKAAATQEKLEAELNGYRANLLKESVRMGQNELGDFHYDKGDINLALKCYIKTRDYCMDPKHMIQMCLNVIKVSIELSNFAHVLSYVSKAEQTSSQDPVTASKLRICAALTQLENGKYKLAAKKFLEVGPEIGNHYDDVLAARDVAIYGGLTALATYDRVELKKKVLDNTQFKNFLELAPEVRELMSDFYNSRYASCLSYLAKLKPLLEVDVHLWDHVNPIYEKIRTKAMVQYFFPFVSVDLNAMSQAFNTTTANLEKELSRLILDGQIAARIDSHNKILHARTSDKRSLTFDKVMTMGVENQAQTKATILRLNLLKNEFFVKPPRSVEDDIKTRQ